MSPDNFEIRAGVIGWPVAHSRSPLIHRFWLRQYGIANGCYDAIAVEPDRVARTLEDMADQGYAGVNVTIPHKGAVFDYILHHGRVASEAHRLKAVNTVVFSRQGVEGYNSDGPGFMAGLKQQAPAWRPGPVVIIGAGGAARAVAAALADAGAGPFTVVNRTLSHGRAVLETLGLEGRVLPLADASRFASGLGDAGLVVNATSLGMAGSPALTPDLTPLPPEAVVCDIVYAPLHTPLLKAAAARGLGVVDGLGMLLHQAVPGFEAWFGVRPEVTDALRRHIVESLSL